MNQRATSAEQVLIDGDLSPLTPEQRLSYYNKVCESLGLNPLTKPFAYIRMNNKLVLYAMKDCTEQLRKVNKVSLTIASRELIGGVFVVTARATSDGRTDESVGAVPIAGLGGESLANAYMKAETKAKRRVTLSICGLGMLDESEASSVPGAQIELERPPVAQIPHQPEPVKDPFVDPPVKPDKVTAAEHAQLVAAYKATGKWTPAQINEYLKLFYQKDKFGDLNKEEFKTFLCTVKTQDGESAINDAKKE